MRVDLFDFELPPERIALPYCERHYIQLFAPRCRAMPRVFWSSTGPVEGAMLI